MKRRSCYLGQIYPRPDGRVRDVCGGRGAAGSELAYASSTPASKQQLSWSAAGIVVRPRLRGAPGGDQPRAVRAAWRWRGQPAVEAPPCRARQGLRRADFWGKVCVAVLTTLATVVFRSVTLL
jgi:hypothetical protein